MSRSSKKGPWVEERLMARIEAMNSANQRTMVKTWSRTSTIFPDMVGHTIAVHDGRKHVPVFVSESGAEEAATSEVAAEEAAASEAAADEDDVLEPTAEDVEAADEAASEED